jgi:two-component system, LuxR family, sensor kinase FixL
LPHVDEAKELATFVSNAISQTRSLAHSLDPVDVETGGLLASLQNLATETQHFFNVSCSLRCGDPGLQVDTPIALALYRIAQEAIHNAITHGEARHIEVELALDAHCLWLRIQDDGIGFQVQSGSGNGIGLRVMEYRARSIGAKLAISSQPNQGTEICCELPRAKCHSAAGASR